MDNHASFGILNGSCLDYSLVQFNSRFSQLNRKLFIMNFNIRSFNSNIDEFSVFLSKLFRLPDFIILTETWNSDDRSADIPGFQSHHCNRPSDKRGGGVSIFINAEFNVKSSHISMGNLPEIE